MGVRRMPAARSARPPQGSTSSRSGRRSAMELLYLSRYQGGEEEVTDAIVGIGGFFEERLDVDRMGLRAGGESQGFGTSVSAKRLRETDQAVIGLIVNILAAIHIG